MKMQQSLNSSLCTGVNNFICIAYKLSCETEELARCVDVWKAVFKKTSLNFLSFFILPTPVTFPMY